MVQYGLAHASGTSPVETEYPTNPSDYMGGCRAPEELGSGFDVTARTCSDAPVLIMKKTIRVNEDGMITALETVLTKLANLSV